jgi:hypothetical protein
MGAPENLQESSLKPDEWGWTRGQRMALGTLLFLLIVVLSIQLVLRAHRIDERIVVLHGQPLTLPTRIDPNTATLEELTRIPHIGEKVAGKLIAYRDERKPLTPDNIVFRSPEDLSHIPGLGKKTAQDLAPYFQFPDDAETQPAE